MRVRSYANWLLYEPRFVWLCAAGLAAAAAVPFLLGASERSIRLSGLALQLGGIITVVWGVVSTRQFFGLPPVRSVLASWWSRAPFKPRNIVVGVGGAQLGFFGEAEAHTRVPVDYSAPVDAQIKALERNVSLIHDRISATHAHARKKHEELRTTVIEHAAQITEVRTTLALDLRRFGTSGLHVSAIGAAWLFLGSIMGSASAELSTWFR